MRADHQRRFVLPRPRWWPGAGGSPAGRSPGSSKAASPTSTPSISRAAALSGRPGVRRATRRPPGGRPGAPSGLRHVHQDLSGGALLDHHARRQQPGPRPRPGAPPARRRRARGRTRPRPSPARIAITVSSVTSVSRPFQSQNSVAMPERRGELVQVRGGQSHSRPPSSTLVESLPRYRLGPVHALRTAPAAAASSRRQQPYVPRAGRHRERRTLVRRAGRPGHRLTRCRPSSVSRTRTPRRSAGFRSRSTRPRASRRSIRLVMVPLVDRVWWIKPPGRARRARPSRRRAARTSNSQTSRSWAAKASRAREVEVPGQPTDPGQHLQGLDVEPGRLASAKRPGCGQPRPTSTSPVYLDIETLQA